MSRFVGRSGEKRFSALCSDAGITCNESHEDDHGWDHVVEFPHVSRPRLPPDRQVPLPAVFVQTKSHKVAGSSIRMKLSNALSLARSPNPCFVVVLQLGDDGAERWQVIHVWNDLLTDIFREARELARNGVEEASFNRHRISIRLSRFTEVRRDDLLRHVRETVQDAGDYASAKGASADPSELVGSLELGPLASIDDLVLHQLGLSASLPATNIELSERRFGVTLPFDWPGRTPPADGEEWRATVHAMPTERCRVTITDHEGSCIHLDGDVIAPAIPNLPESSVRLRFRAAPLDIVCDLDGNATIKASFSDETRYTPADLDDIVRLASWSGDRELDLKIRVADEVVVTATAKLAAVPQREHFALFADWTSTLISLSRHRSAVQPTLSIADLADSDGLDPLHRFITASSMKADTLLASETLTPTFDRAVALGFAEVGTWMFAAIQEFPCISSSRTDDRWRVMLGKPVLLSAHAFRAENLEAAEQLRREYVRVSTRPAVLGLGNALSALR